jgi:hypothetical protein
MKAAWFPEVFSKKGLVRQRAMALLKEQLGRVEFFGATALVDRDDLQWLPGVREFGEAHECKATMEELKKAALDCAGEMEGKAFWLDVKRVGRHGFNSLDVARQVGAFLEGKGFDAGKGGAVIKVEIRDGRAIVYLAREGPGGLPAGLFGRAVLVWEGGYRSHVALLRLAARGFAPTVIAPKGTELPLGELRAFDPAPVGELRSHALKGLGGPLEKLFLYRLAGLEAGGAPVASPEIIGASIGEDPKLLGQIEELSGVRPVRPVGFWDVQRVRDTARRLGIDVNEEQTDWKRFKKDELEREWDSLGADSVLREA